MVRRNPHLQIHIAEQRTRPLIAPTRYATGWSRTHRSLSKTSPRKRGSAIPTWRGFSASPFCRPQSQPPYWVAVSRRSSPRASSSTIRGYRSSGRISTRLSASR